MMGQFGSEQWEYIEDANRMDWKNILKENKRPFWWEKWLVLALFPIKIAGWIMAGIVGCTICSLLLAPCVVGKYVVDKWLEEFRELVKVFQR